MKLRNKKTGEIIGSLGSFIIQNPNHINCEAITKYDSLAELNAEWEDVPEPKEYWYIEPNGVVARIDEWDCCTDSDIEIMKTLGNYFETREEAEKAVERLRARQRLKDKGFRFKGVEVFSEGLLGIDGVLPVLEGANDAERSDIVDSLWFLFGGEE